MNIRGEWRAMLLAIAVAASVAFPGATLVVGPIAGAVAFFTTRPVLLKLDAVNVAVIAFCAYSGLSLLWTIDFDATLRAALVYSALGITLIAIRHAVTNLAGLRIIAAAYLAGCVILIGRFLVLLIERAIDPEAGRLNLRDVNANYAAYAFVAALAVVVMLWAGSSRSRGMTVAAVGFGAVLVSGVLIAGTRSSLPAVVALALWLIASRFLPRPPIKTLVGLVIAAAVVIATGVADRASLVFEAMMGRPTGDWSGRLVLWPLAREDWLNNFIAGTGASTFITTNPWGLGAHDLVLELGTGLGVIGVLLFAVVLWFTLRDASPLLAGAFIVTSAASYLTGSWDASPAAWMVLAIFGCAIHATGNPRTELAGQYSMSMK